MRFGEFKKIMQKHVMNMLENSDILFITNINMDALWELYMNSFPLGTNEIFRKRAEHDCSCCRHFVKLFGNVVVIKNNKVISIWDFNTNDTTYQPVINALSRFVKTADVNNVFVTKEAGFGVDYNHEMKKNGVPIKWEHFRIKLPKKFVNTSSDTVNTVMSKFRDIKNVLKRSLEEISKYSLETVLDLIAQGSLYKGEEVLDKLNTFLDIHNEYNDLPENEKDNYCWVKSIQVGGAIGKIRNHLIGTLLTDITNNIDLNIAVLEYRKKADPENYMHSKPIYNKRIIDDMEKTLKAEGLLPSLDRRYANIDDIPINNVFFENKDIVTRVDGDIFSDLRKEAIMNLQKFDKVEKVSIEKFIGDILPRVNSIELFFENRHIPNLVSLIAAQNKDSKTLFKWNNSLSWAYNLNITDSRMREQVQKAGGDVYGVQRCSIRWNKKGENQNDFDVHCIEPDGNEIDYRTMGRSHPSGGILDVDIRHPYSNVAIENITWPNKDKMQEGIYKFFVYNYEHRGGCTGFDAELEQNGVLLQYEYDKELKHNEKVVIARVEYSRENGFKILESLSSLNVPKIIWGISTNQFHPVSVHMLSPNYWGEQGIGNKHYFFMLNGCKNNTNPSGIFNEFLRKDLHQKYRKVFEALGNKMRVKTIDDQLSGLGFSSTKRNSIICRLKGNFSRIIKLTF